MPQENLLLIEEDNHEYRICLDNRISWSLGRPSNENIPDIILNSRTVSRKHGKFQNMDGIWFYLDFNGKNGTIYNDKLLEPGINGRMKPIMLKNGDEFIFGRTVHARFVTEKVED
ncbi:MAG: FHA domain-containing protein [Pseudobutyrivibrio ruminis]|nr:FHA domain-containing protein [Pseudobutyrivibrio ruminis]